MGDAIRNVSDHAEDLEDGRQLPAGAYALDVDLDAESSPRNAALLADGNIIKVPDASVPEDYRPKPLEGEALQERAQALDIEGRSTMTANQLRKAIAKAEREQEGAGS